ncbi:MAG: hypothetical protein K8S56_06965 [Candidatus Cloacimonetes bacterium]|nr:hypothetical protein [Candidatus Cloacimonadota bacterium]
MRTFFSILILVVVVGLSADMVTVYNDNFAMVNQDIELKLSKGEKNYYFDEIPARLEPNSVIIEDNGGNFTLLAQNFEFDLAGTDRVFEKYLGKEVTIVTADKSTFMGTMRFFDRKMIGVVDGEGVLRLIRIDEVQHAQLAKMPENFFLKPTLNWRILAKKAGNYPLNLSYLTKGMSWEATYNGVWDNEKEILHLSSWITLTNTSGKSFENIDLKLMAGDVRKIHPINKNARYRESDVILLQAGSNSMAPPPVEKEFHDYHLYTFQFPVTINDRQTKQLKLFPDKSVKAKAIRQYRTYGKKVTSIIRFDNDKKSGLGIPLPGGVFKLYQRDSDDNSSQFIGEDKIKHTPDKEEVNLTSGNAFDIVGETTVTDHRRPGKNKEQKDIKVSIRNRSKKSVNIEIMHSASYRWKIKFPTVKPERKDAYNIIFHLELEPGEKKVITWTEMIGY